MPDRDRVAVNEALVRRLFDAFSRREGFRARAVFARDATWVVPGRGVAAGTYRGRDEIFRFLARLQQETDGTYRSQLLDVLASPERAAALYRASGERQGRRIDLDQVLLFEVEDELVTRVVALPSDPETFERFWA